MTLPSAKFSDTSLRLVWTFALAAAVAFLAYKLHDLKEPFAFGHARWSDAYTFKFARAHLDLGIATTKGLNVEGITASGEPIFYLSAPPSAGLVQAFVLYSLGGEYWTVRVLPLLFNLLIVGLIASLAYRLAGVLAVPLTISLYVGMPFVLKYGSSNEGFQIYSIVAGLAGYLSYMRFVSSRQLRSFSVSAGLFAVGLTFNWLAGFMALAMAVHLWFQSISLRIKWVATIILCTALGGAVLATLTQQGLATGEYLYPLKRAMQRSVSEHDAITLGSLMKLQLNRYWGYFGPVVAVFSIYWLSRRILPKLNWCATDTWVVLLWSPGLVYGVLLKDVAYTHDFLMLGFLPGATMMATAGLLNFAQDIGRRQENWVWSKRLSGITMVLVLALHATSAVRSAKNFESQEDKDLTGGGSRVVFHLEKTHTDAILVADRSVSIGSRIDDEKQENYVSIWPYIDYLIRRPVRAVNNISGLRELMCEAGKMNKNVIMLQTHIDGEGIHLRVPHQLIEHRNKFDKVFVLHMHRLSPEDCALEVPGDKS